MPADSVARIACSFYASDHNNNAARWKLEGTVRRVDDGDLELVGITQLLNAEGPHKTTGASGWDVRASLGATTISFDVKGGLGQTVDWFVENEQVQFMEGTLP